MHQEANNNINSPINQINVPDKESALIIANALMKLSNNETKISYSDQNKNKINKLYKEFIDIVNSFDSVFYISKDDLEKLKICVDKMKLFEEDFQEATEDGKIFYNNFFVLLLRIDINLFIEKYESSPEYIKSVINNKYIYASSLFEVGRKDDALKIINEILEERDEEKYFIQKCHFYFLEGNIKELKKALASRSLKEEKTGIYGVFELEIIYSKEKNINKLIKLNKKYKNKPLYHIRMAEMIFKINRKKEKEIQDNLKIAFQNIDGTNLVHVLKFIDTCAELNQKEYAIKLMIDKNYDSYLIKSKLLNLLIYKENKSENEIKKIKQLIKDLENTNLININNVNATLALNEHKDLEAIDLFKKSYEENENIYVASNLISLILKNNDVRNIENLTKYIDTLKKSTKAEHYMLISSAYMLLNDSEKAIENAYISMILAQNNNEFFMRFWVLHAQNNNKKQKTLKTVSNECVIELQGNKKTLIIALDKNITNKFDIKNFHGVKFINDKDFEIKILGKIIGEQVVYKNDNFKIIGIYNKYDFFLKLIFPKIGTGPSFQLITSDDSEDPLKGIKEYLIEAKKSNDEHFRMYDLEKNDNNIGLPLSSFVNNQDKTYRDIMMCLLFSDDDYKLYAGEINPISKNQKYVIDITSLVMLEQYDLLVKLKDYNNLFYVTQSTINTINKTFNYYLNNKKETLSVFVDKENELRKQELTEDDYRTLQEFWREVLEISSTLTIVNHESTLDKNKTEACQIDTLDYSIKNKCILISEDLVLKRLTYVMNNKTINSTNFLALTEWLCDNVEEYLNIVKSLSKGKYIYCINELTLLKSLIYSFENSNVQETIFEIIENIFSTKFLFYNYWEIVFKTLLFIYYYVDISDKVFFDKLILTIQEKCQKYDNAQGYKELNKIRTIINNQ